MLGEKYGLESIDIFNDDGTINDTVGLYAGMELSLIHIFFSRPTVIGVIAPGNSTELRKVNIGNFLHTIRRVWSKRSPESWLDYLRAEGTTQGSIG